jgi:shikimate 5-dehydrogenase
MTPTDLYCTDAIGLTASLKERGLSWDDFANIVIIGAGATAITLLEHWREQNHVFASINLLTRSPIGGQMKNYLLSTPMIHGEFEITPFRPQVIREMVIDSSSTTMLINAASAVSGGDDLSEFAEAIKGYRGFYQELTYGKSRTALYKTLHHSQPERAADGLSMLIEQARASQMIWWGQTVDSELLHRVCVEKLAVDKPEDPES